MYVVICTVPEVGSDLYSTWYQVPVVGRWRNMDYVRYQYVAAKFLVVTYFSTYK
jgi:hypothetical protein